VEEAETLTLRLRASREQAFPKRQAGKEPDPTAMILRVPCIFYGKSFL
jgi:hypothetical protein